MSVSYVVTVYNKAPFLEKVVQGLKQQTGSFDREFIFVDDGSTDGSGELLEQLTADLENTQVIRRANGGMSVALNDGLSRVGKDYVKMLDGDDVLVPTATEALLEAINAKDAILAFGPNEEYNPASAKLDFSAYHDQGNRLTVQEDPLKEIIEKAYFNPSGSFVRREAVEKSRCNERIFIGDYSLWLQIARLGRFVHTERLIFLGPEEAAGRITDNQVQILYDLNLALAHFLQDNRDLPRRYQRQLVTRATGRAWRWAKRKNSKSVLSVEFARHLRSYLPFNEDCYRMVEECCQSFLDTEGNNIRILPSQ